MALYKTIVLELLQENPGTYEPLRSTKRLLPAMEAYALDLKKSHERWKEQLVQARPGSDVSQMISSEALELAIEDLRDRLLCASPREEAEPISLDAAMSYVRRHTPPA